MLNYHKNFGKEIHSQRWRWGDLIKIYTPALRLCRFFDSTHNNTACCTGGERGTEADPGEDPVSARHLSRRPGTFSHSDGYQTPFSARFYIYLTEALFGVRLFSKTFFVHSIKALNSF